MLLQASGIGKQYGATVILSNIHLQVGERERIGLVGANGAGKSTLLRILAGETSYDEGQLFLAKGTTIGYLAQNSGLQSDRSIIHEMRAVFADLFAMENELRELEARMADPRLAENESAYEQVLSKYATLSETFRERGGYAIEATIRGVLHGMGFGDMAPETIVSTLSGGQKTRLALARLLLQKPDLLMLDEPTNYLDIETLTWLESYLKSYPGAVLVVSHDRYFLDALVDTVYEIERTSAKRYVGNYTKFMEQKAADYERNLKLYEKQQDEIARIEDFIRRNIVRATTTKRAQSRRKMLERMERIDRPGGELKRASFSFEVERMSGQEVLEVRNLSMSYDSGKTPLFRNAGFHLRRGDAVALIGPNGIGKSTLLKALVGQMQPVAGSIDWGTNVTIGYYDQEQTGLTPTNTVLDELWNEYPHLEEVRIRTVLGNFLFSGEDVTKKISSLSGGEKARVALAKLMLKNANMLILDEPTNHLDLVSKEVLESALLDYEGTLLFISHDRYFLNRMAEQILELHPDGIRHFLGNYDEFLEKQQELAEINAGASAAGNQRFNSDGNRPKDAPSAKQSVGTAQASGDSPASSYEAEKQSKREERNRQRRLEQLEADIAAAEADIAQMEERLADPAVYNDYVAVQQLQADIEARKAQVGAWYEEWERLMQ
ncbi:ABC-F family ATP-binding cassette domain-containing protein [Paenibacillus sp.]|uniref:ABC-F family ATP-binding cassette domain-containing protein n=1 Tax=Paenibacillus sp. TaxID=58172 RepID=UPI002D3BE63A|nr:ABC-F family ATP-binding cassette domain-containing protein [Paenibacillus sp.]HZG86144.1 ABC-F family ATP-binding cassette domain-containing protein [Paenibacillus sp.]